MGSSFTLGLCLELAVELNYHSGPDTKQVQNLTELVQGWCLNEVLIQAMRESVNQIKKKKNKQKNATK